MFLLQEDYKEIDHVDLDMRFVAEEEIVAIPDAVQYGERGLLVDGEKDLRSVERF